MAPSLESCPDEDERTVRLVDEVSGRVTDQAAPVRAALAIKYLALGRAEQAEVLLREAVEVFARHMPLEHAELRAAIKRAFAGAIADLTPRERTFLRHASVDHLTLDQIAATYRVHRATVARTLKAARERLLAETRAGVLAELKIDPAQLTSALAVLDSKLDLSLSRVLRHS